MSKPTKIYQYLVAFYLLVGVGILSVAYVYLPGFLQDPNNGFFWSNLVFAGLTALILVALGFHYHAWFLLIRRQDGLVLFCGLGFMYWHGVFSFVLASVPPEQIVPLAVGANGLLRVLAICLVLFALMRWIYHLQSKYSELRVVRQRFSDVADAAGEYIWEIDPQGHYTMITSPAEALLGKKIQDILGTTPFDYMPEEEAKRVSGLLEQWASQYESWTGLEHQTLGPDGKILWQRVSGLPILDEAGTLQGFRGTGLDITLEKEAELSQEKLTERLQLAIEAADAGIWEYWVKDGYLEWDKGMFTLYEVDPATFSHDLEQWTNVIVPEDRATALLSFEKSIKDGSSFQTEFSILRKNGERRSIRAQSKILRDQHGEIHRIVGINEDITDRKKTEEALSISEVRFRSLFELSPVGMAMNDFHTGDFIAFNQGLLDSTGYTEEEFRHLSYWQLTPEDYAEKEKEQLEKMKKTGQYGPYEKEYIRKDGSRYPVLLHGFKQTDPAGRQVIWSIIQDISQQKSAEIQLTKAKELAEAANQAKSGFLANMSHEIRTPMNGIIGFSHLAHQHNKDPEVERYLQKIQKSSRSLLSIINDILDYSRIEAGKLTIEPRDLDLHRHLQDAVELFDLQASEKGLLLQLELDESLPAYVSTDPLRLTQILTNLLGNAVKFTEKGHVLLKASLKSLRQDQAVLLFTVQDTGKGIPKDKQHLLFESFSQLDNSITRQYGGTGLGLSITKGLLDRMNGSIWLESQENKGSSFYFTLPVVLIHAAPKTIANPPEEIQQQKDSNDLLICPQPPQTPFHVLLAEDHAANREIAAELLKQADIRVTYASDGEEVVELFKKQSFHAILMDVQMPKLDGLAATRAIRKLENPLDAPIPIIAMTAHAMRGDRENVLAAGLNDYIAKPFDPDEFIGTVSRWLCPMPSIENKNEISDGISTRMSRETDFFPSQMPGLNLAEGLSRMGGNQSAYMRLLQRFSSEALTLLDALTPATLHQLKGYAGNLGAYEVMELCGSLEPSIALGDVPEKQIREIRQALAKVEESIDLLASSPKAAPSTKEPPFFKNRECLESQLSNISRMLKASEYVDLEIMVALEEALPKDESFSRIFNTLKSSLESFDYATALEQIQQLEKSLSLTPPAPHSNLEQKSDL